MQMQMQANGNGHAAMPAIGIGNGNGNGKAATLAEVFGPTRTGEGFRTPAPRARRTTPPLLPTQPPPATS